jgi:thiamine-phosphate pyrophosphorylase
MKRYSITDSIDVVRRAVDLDADLIQIRAKELTARELMRLVEQAVEIAGKRVLVNTRADIALACGAGGVHLPANSPTAPLRSRLGREFLIAVSCHSIEELQAAERDGANFAVFGPVFYSPGKGPAVGIEALREAVRSVRMPVYALGGITERNAPLCIAAGAYGIAGIRLFSGFA